MNMFSVRTDRPASVFSWCPSTELNLEAESRQDSVSHWERTGTQGQFKIVSFSQECFFSEVRCCKELVSLLNLKKVLFWDILHIYLLLLFFSSSALSFIWIFPFPLYTSSLYTCVMAMRCVWRCISATSQPVPGRDSDEVRAMSHTAQTFMGFYGKTFADCRRKSHCDSLFFHGSIVFGYTQTIVWIYLLN